MVRSRPGFLIVDQLVGLGLIAWTVSARGDSLSVREVAVLAVGAGTVTVRRITPEVACGLTIAALAASQNVSTTHTVAVAVALLLDFYALGRRCDTTQRSVVAAGLLVAPVAVLIAGPQGKSVFDVATSWSFACVLPFSAGRAIVYHDAVNRSLRAWTEHVGQQQKEQASEAAALERARVARELHDVIAHNVSVMVIQAVAAKRTAPSNPQKAAQALNTVEACGHEALREMRRLVGILHRDDLNCLEVSSLDAEDLAQLAERAESAGLAVTIQVEGEPRPLPAGLDLTARRVVQEALTNAMRYAAPASATVTMTYADSHVVLDVCDSGRDPAANGSTPLPRGGKGLIGMSERVGAHGGEFAAGPTPSGGFRVHARLPLPTDAPEVEEPLEVPTQPPIRSRCGWFDAALAFVLFLACEAQLLASWHHRGSILAETAILVGLTAPVAVRRRSAIATTAATMGFLILAAVSPLDVISPDAMLFVLFIPPYSAGAYAQRRQALAGLAICLAGWLALALTTTVGTPAWAALSSGLILASWSLGRAIRARRRGAAELSRTAAVISSEAEDLALLAVADERSRIARRLQAAVARSVADMIIQTHAARVLLDRDLAAADAAMAEIDLTGRRALDEMRAVLGVLRVEHAEAELAPQPGLGQLPALVESTRRDGGSVELRVEGEPRPIGGLSDLGVYRIAEEALRMLYGRSNQPMTTTTLTVIFGDSGVALELHTCGAPVAPWPTPLMTERAALSGGTIECSAEGCESVALRLELPTELDEVLL